MRPQQQQQSASSSTSSSPSRGGGGSISPRGLAAALHHQSQQGPPFNLTANSREAYRDLLIFEERLKQNSQRLATQRRKYEAFLISLIFSIVFLTYKVFLTPSPYTFIQFLNSGLLLIGIVTLVLFFATGVYSEKIAYAYKFVPQANRALRYFNIYLNTKQPPRSWSFNPFRFFRGSGRVISTSTATTSSSSPASPPGLSRTISSTGSARSSPVSRSPSGSYGSSTSSRSRSPYGASSSSTSSRANPIPLAPLPPASNPRGELVFSSKVNPNYREGYEKYRADWEKRRKPSRHELSWSARLVSSVLRSRSTSSNESTASTNKTATSSSSTATQEKQKPKTRISPKKEKIAGGNNAGSSLTRIAGSSRNPVSYIAATSDDQSDSSVNNVDQMPPSPVSRGRDSRARPLTRSGSNSSMSSMASGSFSASPPISRRMSPLRNQQPDQSSFPITSSTTRSNTGIKDDGKTAVEPMISGSPSPSSRASTPDLIREDDEYLSYYPHNGHLAMSASAQSLLLARRRQNLTSASESSLASGSARGGDFRMYRNSGQDEEEDSILESPPDMSPQGKVAALPRSNQADQLKTDDGVPRLAQGHRPRASSFNEFLEELREEESETMR